jgi:hypothetical protein
MRTLMVALALLVPGSAFAQTLVPTSFGKVNKACKFYANRDGAPFRNGAGQYVTNTPAACDGAIKAGKAIAGSFNGRVLSAGGLVYNIGPDGHPASASAPAATPTEPPDNGSIFHGGGSRFGTW